MRDTHHSLPPSRHLDTEGGRLQCGTHTIVYLPRGILIRREADYNAGHTPPMSPVIYRSRLDSRPSLPDQKSLESKLDLLQVYCILVVFCAVFIPQ